MIFFSTEFLLEFSGVRLAMVLFVIYHVNIYNLCRK